MAKLPQHKYSTDLTDSQWHLIAGYFRRPSKRGAPRKYDRRSVVNAILYLVRTGCQQDAFAWRLLPREFPPWKAVYQLFYRWRKSGLWRRIHDALRKAVRRRSGRRAAPTAAILDSQSVKTTHIAGDARGYDGAKRIKGRKRHVAVDTLGLILAVAVHSAGVQDQDGAPLVLLPLRERFGRLKAVFADGAYGRGGLPRFVRQTLGIVLRPVRRPAPERDPVTGKKRFVVQSFRWIVERTFAWISLCRRHSKDYEINPETSESLLHVSMIHLMLKRLAPASKLN